MSADQYIESVHYPGLKVPKIALGTWKAPAEKTKEAVTTAVEAGFRFIDTANDYDNEHSVGEAIQQLIKDGTVKREELFIQSKLWNSNHRPEHVRADLEATLKDLGVDYIDSFVIHWPMAVPSKGDKVALRPDGCYPAHHSKGTLFPLDDEGYYCVDHDSHYVETWLEMEKLVDAGLTKSIGLSNFNKRQIREVLDIPNAKYKPAILQNESHPYLQEKDLRDFCKTNGIIFQAYSALGSGDRPWRKEGSLSSGAPFGGHEVLQNPELVKIAEKHGGDISVAQVVLRWHAQMGGAAVCKSVTPSRIQQNYDLWNFELDDDDLKVISGLNYGWRHLIWAETSAHADYPFKDDLPYNYVVGKPGQGATAGAK